MFIDQVASAVKDVQNARVAGICQPVIYIGIKRKSVNGLLHPGPSLMYTPPTVREFHYLFERALPDANNSTSQEDETFGKNFARVGGLRESCVKESGQSRAPICATGQQPASYSVAWWSCSSCGGSCSGRPACWR